MKRLRGATLIELMVGTLVLFIACTAAASVMATSSRYLLGERSRSQMLQAMWQTTQRMSLAHGWASAQQHNMPGVSVSTNNANFPLDGQWAAKDQWRLRLLTDTLSLGPTQTFSFEMVSPSSEMRDVTTPDADSPYVFFVGPSQELTGDLQSSAEVNIWNGTSLLHMQSKGIMNPLGSSTASPSPEPVRLSSAGLAVPGDMSVLYASDNNTSVIQTNANPLGDAAWPSPQTDQQGLPDGGFPAGMAINKAGTEVWIVDFQNRGIFHYDIPTHAYTKAPSPAVGAQPLVNPSAIAWDEGRNLLWVTDPGNLCLRMFDIGSQTWSDPVRFTSPSMPRGVGLDRLDNCVWSADATSIWLKYQGTVYTPGWYQYPLPDDLQYKVASVHFNDVPVTSYLYIVTTDGDLWQLHHAGMANSQQVFTLLVHGQ